MTQRRRTPESSPRRRFASFRAGALALVLLALGCARETDTPKGPVAPARPEVAQAATVAMWRTQFDGHRAQWAATFAGPDSPLPEAVRGTFSGPGFYPFDENWRFVGDLERLDPPRFIEVGDTRGTTQDYVDYGRFPIERDGVVATLEVHRPVDHPDQFFIAFFDSTNGRETYAGGRYVHLDSVDTHRFVLDLNKAYNPYCAYDSSWICPLPPRANALPFAVRAGMMMGGAH